MAAKVSVVWTQRDLHVASAPIARFDRLALIPLHRIALFRCRVCAVSELHEYGQHERQTSNKRLATDDAWVLVALRGPAAVH